MKYCLVESPTEFGAEIWMFPAKDLEGCQVFVLASLDDERLAPLVGGMGETGEMVAMTYNDQSPHWFCSPLVASIVGGLLPERDPCQVRVGRFRIFDLPTPEAARKFQLRAWETGTFLGVKFLDIDDDQEALRLTSDAYLHRSEMHERSLIPGYGDMRWSISSSPDGADECTSIYFDFAPLPEEYGDLVAVRSVFDGEHTTDLTADIIQLDELEETIREMVTEAIDCFADNELQPLVSEADEVLSEMILEKIRLHL
jgi:hypothetical protein